MPRDVKVKIPTMDDVLPREFREHLMEAYKESLLAFRSLIDAQVKRIEEGEADRESKVIKKIEIE
ncbi:MAG: hypothetical protein ACLFVI_05870 [Archaeoglobaceae archaeon]